MRIWLAGAALFFFSCDAFLKLNPDYCDDGVQCAAGAACDLAQRRCVELGADALMLSEIAPATTGLNGGAMVTLSGQGFRPGAEVDFAGNVSPEVSFVSATELRAIVPTGTCGPAKVSVRNPDGVQLHRKPHLAAPFQ